MKKQYFYLWMILLFMACNSSNPPKEQTSNTSVESEKAQARIPENALPVFYRSRINIKGEVDGIEAMLIFDTGADNLCLDTTFYNNSNFSYQNFGNAYLPGVGLKHQNVKIILDTVNFRFGENHYQTKMVPLCSLKPIVGDFADGIIGFDYFASRVLAINYPDQYLMIYDDIFEADTSGYVKIQCEKIRKKLYVPLRIQINESLIVEGNFNLDLGSGGAIAFTQPAARKFDFDRNITTKVKSYNKYGGIGGETSRYKFRAKSLQIGIYNLNHPIMDYSLDESGALSSDKHYGLLGNDILERFDVIIDFQNSTIYIKPNEDFNQPFKTSTLGFSFVDLSETYGAWVVTGFSEGSSASACGMQVDDRIIYFNGQRVTEIDFDQRTKLMHETGKINLKVQRGNQELDFIVEAKEVL